jgi:hypothetical protein
MTNGLGELDRPTVPEKSPNNAGQPVAEGMEGRGLAKANLPQQNASRIQSRSNALSALGRVRQAAAKDKKLRFTALLHHIYNLEMLRMAYFSLQGKWLRAAVGGHIRYGVPMNQPALATFRFRVGWLWRRALSWRSQNGRVLWDRMRRLITRWLPLPSVCHPYPLRRMGVVT